MCVFIINWHWASCTPGCRRLRQRVRRYVSACLPWYADAWPTDLVMPGIHCWRLLCETVCFTLPTYVSPKIPDLVQVDHFTTYSLVSRKLRDFINIWNISTMEYPWSRSEWDRRCFNSFSRFWPWVQCRDCQGVMCFYFKFVNTVFGWTFGVKEQRQKGNGSQIPPQHETHEFPWQKPVYLQQRVFHGWVLSFSAEY